MLYNVVMLKPNGEQSILCANGRTEWSRSQAYKQAADARTLPHFAGYKVTVCEA